MLPCPTALGPDESRPGGISPRPSGYPTSVELVPRTAQLKGLTCILDEAVALQIMTDRAVAACGEPGPVPGQTARDCHRQSVALHRLLGRLRSLPLTDPDLVAAQHRAGRLLVCQQWMVRQALNLAFTMHPDPRTEAARLGLNGLGRPADDLRRLRDRLRDQAPAGN
ncbi:hypothetical protein GCM10022207_41000 [Streptomyces lannensis]|uniref:Uncharacterized protein n=1 Tax=Streptomyces lannensis TaxID=766498 RepID=A0ABP7KAU1_9ACTN